MFDLFLNPWSMMIGAGLVVVPIIIHLINRMRFKRVHWAAMEFLLKAQKRMKRKLIFQQLLLLLLRCLLVALIGLIVGRFVGCNPLEGRETRTTAHVAILDDSPSMGDFFRGDDGQITDAFAQAKKVLVEQIAPSASQATTAQTLDVIRLSDLNSPRSFARLNTTTIDELKTYLQGYKPTPVRGSLAAAIKKASETFPTNAGQDTARIIHVLSDFRTIDWEEDGPAIKKAIEDLAASRTKVHLIDVAHPYRKDEKRPPLFHDNVGIIELKPAKLTVARFEPLEFTMRVRNFGASELKDLRFAISVNGDDGKGLSVQLPSLPGNDERTVKFTLTTFDRLGTAEKPLDRFSLITAKMEAEEAGGIVVDNSRYAVVEVREKLPILVVDGKTINKDKKESDSFYLRTIFTNVVGGFNWVAGTPRDLEGELRQYSCVFLLNVPTVSEAIVKNLEQYVREGGGIGFFLGPDVKPADYNKLLYADGNGIFPVSLPDRPTEPLPEDKRQERLFSFTKKVLLKDKTSRNHPALASMYNDDRGMPFKDDDLEKFFNFVIVNQHWPVRRIGKWRDDRNVSELYCMPNEQSMGEFDKPATDLINKLPIEEPKYAKYKVPLSALKLEIRKTALSTDPLYKLANLLDRLLSDQRSEGDPAEALLREFWTMPENADIKNEAIRLRDAVKYGDPLYVAKQYGRGRVTLITTTAGETWNDWPSGPGRPSYVPVMSEMERYLSGGGSEENRTVGTPIEMKLEATKYKPLISRALLTFDPFILAGQRANGSKLSFTDLKEQTVPTLAGTHNVRFADTANPGAYLLSLTQIRGQSSGSDATEIPEYQAFAMNVDARREGDLRRASQDDILRQAPTAELHSAADAGWVDVLKNKRTDMTEGGWIFLAVLLLLIGEQALATRLSYNSGSIADAAV